MNEQIAAFREELDDVRALVAGLDEQDWQRTTQFKAWTIWDVIAHLHLADHMGVTTLQGPEAFNKLMNEMTSQPMNVFAREWLGELTGEQLRSRWLALAEELVEGLSAADPEVRLTWPGPGMKPRMFATARQMEYWAHATEIYDLLGTPRTHGDRLINVATIGVRTYGWTFANRKLEPPEPAPRVTLTAPSGAKWEWHEDVTDQAVTGSAVEFCQVVTQVRNVADTALEITGENAERWMAMAQCFAGPPEEPPAPGSRGTSTNTGQ